MTGNTLSRLVINTAVNGRLMYFLLDKKEREFSV
jgi:hypothetical protein